MVKGGRTFGRLIDSLSKVNNRNAKILLSSEFCKIYECLMEQ